MALAPRSIKCLEGVHPDLVKVVRRADELGAQFIVTEGLRTLEQQKEYVRKKKSRTLKSRHLTGHAVDVCDAKATYAVNEMLALGKTFKRAAADVGVPIEWGGDWKQKPTDRIGWDSPHFQLPLDEYPANVTHVVKDVKEPVVTVVSEPKPLAQSGTIWGTLAGTMAAVGAFFEQSASAVIEWAAKLAEFGPAQSALASMGGNIKSITLGLGIGSAVYVISRRVKAKQEGNPG